MKNVLVTGASQGIGKAISIVLAGEHKCDYQIAVHYHSNKALANDTLEQIERNGGSGRLLCFDVSDRHATKIAIEKDMEKYGSYYGIVCNAGITCDKPFPMLTDDDWDKVLDTNIGGFYNVLKPSIMPMIKSRKPGRIVTMSSLSGISGNRGQSNYSASKAAIIGASKSLSIELAKRNITVNCVAPGFIETNMTNTVDAELIKKHIPMRRPGTAEEVAALVCFLLSDSASYITRQVISVNGGLL